MVQIHSSSSASKLRHWPWGTKRLTQVAMLVAVVLVACLQVLFFPTSSFMPALFMAEGPFAISDSSAASSHTMSHMAPPSSNSGSSSGMDGSSTNGSTNNNDTATAVDDIETTDNPSNFPFTMRSSPDCAEFLNDPSVLSDLAQVALQAHYQRHSFTERGGGMIEVSAKGDSATSSILYQEDWNAANLQWELALAACHSPQPQYGNDDYLVHWSLESFVKNYLYCQLSAVDEKHCAPLFRRYLQDVYVNHSKTNPENVAHLTELERQLLHQQDQERGLTTAMRCALHVEFGLLRRHFGVAQKYMDPPAPRRPANWYPNRTILLALVDEDDNDETTSDAACRLASTAVPRGWNVYLVPHNKKQPSKDVHGLTRTALLHVLESLKGQDNITAIAQETFVVFLDTTNQTTSILVQQSPKDVVDEYLLQPMDFVFGGQHDFAACAPFEYWPLSLGIANYTCTKLFPPSRAPEPTSLWAAYKVVRKPLVDGRKFVFPGAWMGVASAALVVLQELSRATTRRPQEFKCPMNASPTFMANAAYLRHPKLLGIDMDYLVFAPNATQYLESKLLKFGPYTRKEQNRKYAKKNTTTYSDDSGEDEHQAFCQRVHVPKLPEPYAQPNDVPHLLRQTYCPAFLQFQDYEDDWRNAYDAVAAAAAANATAIYKSLLRKAYTKLTSSEAFRGWCRPGSLSMIDVDNESVKSIYNRASNDGDSSTVDANWQQCFKRKACFYQ